MGDKERLADERRQANRDRKRHNHDRERHDRAAQRWSNVMLWCAVGTAVWFFVCIATLNLAGSPMPPWVGIILAGFPLLALGTGVARYMARVARADAAAASAFGAAAAVRDAAATIKAHQRYGRRRTYGRNRKR